MGAMFFVITPLNLSSKKNHQKKQKESVQHWGMGHEVYFRREFQRALSYHSKKHKKINKRDGSIQSSPRHLLFLSN